MARPPRGKRPSAAPRFVVQPEFAPGGEFCRQFLGIFGRLLSSEVTVGASARRLCCSKPCRLRWLAERWAPRPPHPRSHPSASGRRLHGRILTLTRFGSPCPPIAV